MAAHEESNLPDWQVRKHVKEAGFHYEVVCGVDLEKRLGTGYYDRSLKGVGKPVRACIESRLAAPGYLVEVQAFG
ncbi:MAG: hypothetical protein JO110_28405 [Acetobacteraceae bacterium]|nr:hypothetical protein [Acetobacteraceae bacterium]